MNKNTVNKITEFFNNRNCIIRTNLKGIEVIVEYSNGKLFDVYKETKNGKKIHPTYNSITNIPSEIEPKCDINLKGVLIPDEGDKNYKFIVYDIIYIEDKIEWEDDIEDELYTTTTNSSLYNKINCAGYLDFDIVPLVICASNLSRSRLAVEEAMKSLKETCLVINYPIKDFVVLYNDTAWTKMLKKIRKPVEMKFKL